MSFTLNRRNFLLSLIALGANYSLSDDATAQAVTKAWVEALAEPWYFSVDTHGTITEPDYPQNETWGEIFSIDITGIKTPEDLVREVDRCMPLREHFSVLASDELDSLIEDVDSDTEPCPARRRHINQVIAALEAHPDEGWYDWIQLEGQAGVERFKDMIAEWADEPANYIQIEYFPADYGAQGKAMVFFESLGHQILKALGVVIVEGEHPGSTYYAAELRKDIESANETAAGLKVPFRFKRVGA
jgi:hypothetical protein